MTFQELFQQVKTRFLGADVSQVSDPTRIQINITGQAAGTFYGEIKGGNLARILQLAMEENAESSIYVSVRFH